MELPILDRPIDNTALAAYMTCPKKYEYSMVQHRRSRGSPSPAIAYGTTWHKLLETHYKTGGNSEQVFLAGVKSWEQHDRPDDHRTFERCWMEYQNYVAYFGTPDEEDAKTVGYPDEPAVEMNVNVDWPGAPHPYAGKIDRIIEWNGQYYIEDHKTTSRMGDYYFKQFELKNQMQGYVWLGQLLIPGVHLAGIRINAHAIYKRESKFERQIISFSTDRLKQWEENYAFWIARIKESYATGIFPRNFDACDGKFGMCQYAGVCSMPPRLQEAVLEQDFEINPWNPLESEDEGAE